MGRPKLTEDQWREAAELYATGESCAAVASKYGVNASSIYEGFRRRGVQFRPVGAHKSLPDNEAKEFKRLYDQGMNIKMIAAQTGRNKHTISDHLGRLGVKIRSGRALRPDQLPIGSIFGRLVTVETPFADGSGKSFVRVRCECGTIKTVRTVALRRGTTQSCGCLAIEHARRLGQRRGAENGTWKGGVWTTTKQGYKIWTTSRPDGRSLGVLQHVLAMEHHLGRPLVRGEQVHHIDSAAKDDNDQFCKACGAEWPELESDGLLHCECGWSGKSNLQLRITAHGAGSAYACSDCGSQRIHPVPLADPEALVA